jgi:release factor glutamine methyltransferase
LGSGAISIELLARFSCLTMHASEVSGAAIDMARKNADRILLDNSSRLYVHRSESPLAVWESFDAAAPRADFVISNPPYLSEYDQIDHEVLLHEPKAALFPAGDDVLYFYREIAAGGALNIRAGGFAFVEVPHERAHDIERLFVRHGWRVRLVNDLTGRPRVLVALLGGNEDK